MTRLTTADVERTSARYAFLEIVRRLQPEVLADLAGIADRYPLRSSRTPAIQALQREHGGMLRVELERWAADYRINTSWVLLNAVETIQMWMMIPRFKSYWCPLRCGISVPEPEPFIFTHDAPDLTRGTLAQAEKTIRDAFGQALARYLEDCLRQCEERGWQAAKQRRSPEEHLEWLVRYQVLEESLSAIAQSVPPIAAEKTPRETVGKAVRDMAGLIELPLRVSKGGRPRKPAT